MQTFALVSPSTRPYVSTICTALVFFLKSSTPNFQVVEKSYQCLSTTNIQKYKDLRVCATSVLAHLMSGLPLGYPAALAPLLSGLLLVQRARGQMA